MTRSKGLAGLLLALFLFGCEQEEPMVRTMWRGDDAFKAGAYVEAVRLYGDVATAPAGAVDDLHRAGAFVNRGNSYAQLKRYDAAIADYDAAIGLAPAMAEAWAGRAIVHDTLGRTDRAIGDYKKALELNPALGDPPGFFARLMGEAAPTTTVADRLAFLEKSVGADEGTP